ncbi:MAG TPA: hypothetical protein VLA88_02505 [Candidatus Saccharimonadales bacterium]|nr:hypothetical protein [Candidatus Saccharimonadales bacterium]
MAKKKQPAKQKVTDGQFAGAIVLLLILAVWSLFAIFKTLPHNIPKVAKEVRHGECRRMDLTTVVTPDDQRCLNAIDAGEKSAAVFNTAVDLVGVGLLVGFGPKLWRVTQRYHEQKK